MLTMPSLLGVPASAMTSGTAVTELDNNNLPPIRALASGRQAR